jgi:hypothetical protein
MKSQWIASLPVVAALILIPAVTPAQTLASETPGVVELTHAIDGKKLTSGAIVQMRLTHTVHLSNGTSLPTGTWLNATIAEDDLQIEGKAKLALRFTEAKMKDGKTIPIKATILAVATEPQPVANDPDSVQTVLLVPANLQNQSDDITASGVASGVDLHSKASSQNSGVFVTKTKDDIKLPLGTKMELALTSGM